MQNRNSMKKMFDALKLLIEAWQELGLDQKAPEEFANLKFKKKQIGDTYGWI